MLASLRQAAGLGFQSAIRTTLGVRGYAANIIAKSEMEQEVAKKLQESLPKALHIQVKDTSGGCGAMFQIEVVADEFKGLNTMKQHRMLYTILSDFVSKWHGVTFYTKPSP